jgi:hypothetical protein
MLGEEELPGHLSPHPRPVSRRDRGVGRQSDRSIERPDPPTAGLAGRLGPLDVVFAELEGVVSRR